MEREQHQVCRPARADHKQWSRGCLQKRWVKGICTLNLHWNLKMLTREEEEDTELHAAQHGQEALPNDEGEEQVDEGR